MTREAFIPAYERLCRGHRYTATEEKAEATFKAIGHYSEIAWQDAVEVLLLDPRMPGGERLIAAIDQAADRRRRQSPGPLYPRRIPEDAGNREYGQARLDLFKAQIRGKVTPEEIPDKLLELADRFPHMAPFLVHEAEEDHERLARRAPPAVTAVREMPRLVQGELGPCPFVGEIQPTTLAPRGFDPGASGESTEAVQNIDTAPAEAPEVGDDRPF